MDNPLEKTIERIKMLKAMEFIARHINAEDIFWNNWAVLGVADGDIQYGDLAVQEEDPVNLDYYITDEEFPKVMALFLDIMVEAHKDGGLYAGTFRSTRPDGEY